MYIYGHMKNGDTTLQQVEKQQTDFKKELNETTSGNPFSITTGFIKKFSKTKRNKKKKHNKIVILARSKLNSIKS